MQVIGFFILLGCFVWAGTNVVVCRTISSFAKALWLALLLVPGVGFITWFFIGPRASI
ncbi:hypothetical protein [Pararhodospirillum oryzae]|uniref:Cardiolipin synthase N-terminal domain-containing protein n=1 Tax=Pararhodospirillum oryzae TaxID=478448 RepID=A0A512H5S4_9PROT|nr:hypothetical protein [Pararhodospirillum oryzae]GEO80825.1 hypothetical protein ROR02_09560 [Pararhodospirillum oryzae]